MQEEADRARNVGGGGDGDKPCDPPLANLGKGFADIAGARQAIDDLVTGFVFPQRYPGLFQTAASGLLLFGPPGTGKTLLAKAAVASLPNVAMFAPSPGSLKGRYVGETEKNIQHIFECAITERKLVRPNATKSIIFFDEFENIARKRDSSDPGLSASVTTLLQQMDGIGSSPDVAVMAATNYPQDLDDAVMRRFDARIFVDLPSYEARLWIILRAIAKHYQPELVDQIEIYQRYQSDEIKIDDDELFDWSPDILRNIRTYGRRARIDEEDVGARLLDCKEACDFNRVIQKQDIRDIARMTGPRDTPEVREVVMRTGRTADFEFSADALSSFGYSGSDIDKLMTTMMNTAARRAVPTGPEHANTDRESKVFVDRDLESNQIRRYIHCAPNVCTAFHQVIPTSQIPQEDWPRLVTYDFTLCDVCHGFATYTSTVNPNVYRQLIDYHAPRGGMVAS